jgi:hypothetical protein
MRYLKKFNEALAHLNFPTDYDHIADICRSYQESNVFKGDWEITEDGLVNVFGDVDIHTFRYPSSSRVMTRLPIRFGRVTGSFTISSHPYINTLEGLPHTVDGNLVLSQLPITSLVGCPKHVGGDFISRAGRMESLIGAPEFVGGKIILDFNTFESSNLEGFPRIVGGDVKIEIKNLENLEGCCKHVKGDFHFEGFLKSLEGGPDRVEGDLWVIKSKLTSLVGGPTVVGGDYYVSENELKNLIGSPEKIFGTFKCSENPITSLEGGPEEVSKSFVCSETNIESLEFAPKRAEKIVARRCRYLYNPEGIRDFQGKLWIDDIPIDRIYHCFLWESDPTKSFRDSLDYNYVVKKDGKWSIIKWKFLEALEEIGVSEKDFDEELSELGSTYHTLFLMYELI